MVASKVFKIALLALLMGILLILISGCGSFKSYRYNKGFKDGTKAIIAWESGNPLPAYNLAYLQAVTIVCHNSKVKIRALERKVKDLENQLYEKDNRIEAWDIEDAPISKGTLDEIDKNGKGISYPRFEIGIDTNMYNYYHEGVEVNNLRVQ